MLSLCTDSLERVCLAFLTMKLGSQEEKSMTLHLTKGDYVIYTMTIEVYEYWVLTCDISSCVCSYLKSLVPSFNECADKFIERLRPLADGKTTVPMKDHLAEVYTIDWISSC